jgi:hypothetical protein
MKRYLAAIAGIILMLSAVPSPARLPDDEEARAKLVGTWIIPVEQYEMEFAKEGGYIFRADGTFSMFGLFQGAGHRFEFMIEGKWKVEKGYLVEEITKTDHPALLPVGKISRDALVSVSDKEFRFLDKGKERYVIRQR